MEGPPGNILTQLETTYGASGIVFRQLENYGGEPLYELVTAQGESFLYVSLADLKGSTLVVMWPQNPLAPTT